MWQIIVKHQKQTFCCTVLLRSGSLATGYNIHLCDNFPLVVLWCLTSFSHYQFRLIICIFLKKKFVFLTTVSMETWKKNFFSYYSYGWLEKKMLHQKYGYYRCKLRLKNLSELQKYQAKKQVTALFSVNSTLSKRQISFE